MWHAAEATCTGRCTAWPALQGVVKAHFIISWVWASVKLAETHWHAGSEFAMSALVSMRHQLLKPTALVVVVGLQVDAAAA